METIIWVLHIIHINRYKSLRTGSGTQSFLIAIISYKHIQLQIKMFATLNNGTISSTQQKFTTFVDVKFTVNLYLQYIDIN